MKAGFAKINITPRLGVELCGFGPYLHRYAKSVRDDLWAKAFALEQNGRKIVIVSCDLIGIAADTVKKVQSLLAASDSIDSDSVLVHCTHTHSGPATCPMFGWGEMDEPYVEQLPYRIAKACRDALADMKDASLSYAEVPCEGIGCNREYDEDCQPLDRVLKDSWRPVKNELTDTSCHIIKAESDGKLMGFAVYFGCHPVVCCASTNAIHGDYSGIAMNCLQREFPGSVGLFLQGAHGDVNTCVVHKGDKDSMLALDLIAARFANAVRTGLAMAKPIAVDEIKSIVMDASFTELRVSDEELNKLLHEREEHLHNAGGIDGKCCDDMVLIKGIRRIFEKLAKNERTVPVTKVHGIKIGALALLGAPFEIFQAIKNDVKKSAVSQIPLVMSMTDDYVGYAVDKVKLSGYAAKLTPMFMGRLPFKNIHEELVSVLLELDKKLNE